MALTSRAMPSLASCLIRILIGLLLFATPAPAFLQPPRDWPEWRGGVQGSVPSAPEPAGWKVLWRTPIPGEGHSSPIVSGEDIFLTTALESPEPKVLLQFLRQGLGVILALIAFLVGYLVGREHIDPSRTRVARPALTLFLLASTIVVAAFGESLLHVRVSPERAWLSGALFGVMVLNLSAVQGGRHVPLFLVALSLLLAATVPDRSRTVLSDPLGPVALFIYATALWPSILALGWWFTNRGRPTLLAIGALVPFAFAAWIAVFEAGSTRVYTVPMRYEPWTSPVTLGGLTFLIAGLACYRALYPSAWLRLVMTGSLAGAIAYASVFLIEHSLVWSIFLNYLAGEVEPKSVLPNGYLAVAATACAGGLVLSLFGSELHHRRVKVGLGILSVFACSLYFGYSRFVPKEARLYRSVLKVDRRTGQIVWISRGPFGDRGTMHEANSPATPTPVTEGSRIYAYYGTPGLFAVDREGNEEWRSGPLPFETQEGPASSPILVHDRLVLLSESTAGRSIAAYDKETGNRLWKTDRHRKMHPYAGNCRTPIALRINGRDVVLVWGYEDLAAYDPSSGAELWSLQVGTFGDDTNPVVTPVHDGERLVLVGPSRIVCLSIKRLGTERNPILWDLEVEHGAECSSPVLAGGRIYTVADYGYAACWNATDGTLLWTTPIRQQHYTSVLLYGNCLYLASTLGRISVLSLDGRVQERHDIGEKVYASPAGLPEGLLVRSKQALWLIRP